MSWEQQSVPNCSDDLLCNIAQFLEANRESTVGVLDEALMRLAAVGTDMVEKPEYAELAKLFAREIDAVKLGSHVLKEQVRSLERKALHMSERRRDNQPCPNFQYFSENFQPTRNGTCLFQSSTLICQLFHKAQTTFGEIMKLEKHKFVTAIDSDLKTVWTQGPRERNQTIFGKAEMFKRQYHDAFIAFKRGNPIEKRKNPKRSLVRDELLQQMGQEPTPIGAFYKEQRQKAMNEASQHSIAFKQYALAMYMVKYSRLLERRERDEDNFPWVIVGEELVAIKREERHDTKVEIDAAVLGPLLRTATRQA